MHEATRTMLQPQLQSFLYFVLHTTIKYDTEPRSPTELQDDLLPPHGHPHHRRHLEVRRSFHRQHSPKKWDLRNQETCERSVGGEEAKLAGTTCLLTLFLIELSNDEHGNTSSHTITYIEQHWGWSIFGWDIPISSSIWVLLAICTLYVV